MGAAVLNPWEKKERKEFSGSKVVCRSESLGEERKEFSSSKGCRSLREAAIGQELAVAVGVLGERIGYRGI